MRVCVSELCLCGFYRYYFHVLVMFSLAFLYIYFRYITRFNENLQCSHTLFIWFPFLSFSPSSSFIIAIVYFPCNARTCTTYRSADTRWKDINASDWIVDRINACDHRCLISIQCTETTTPKGFGTPTRYCKVSRLHIYRVDRMSMCECECLRACEYVLLCVWFGTTNT